MAFTPSERMALDPTPLLIGGAVLPSRAVMAPIAGLTDAPFRRIVMDYGAGLACTELLSANALVRDSARTRAMLPAAGEPRPLAAQLFGGDPAVMAEAARITSESPCDFVDVNFGCPVKKVVKTGGGAAALRDPALAAAIMGAVARASQKPVTAKIRTGWDTRSVNAVEMAKRLADAGAAAITVHGRTASQGYSGHADWEVIARVARAVAIPVIGNGDIASPETAARRMTESGVAGVMIGRAALGAPWLFTQINGYLASGGYAKVTPEEIETAILRHMALMAARYGERRAARLMRTRLAYYSRGLAGGSKFRAAVNKTESLDAMRSALGELLGAGAQGMTR